MSTPITKQQLNETVKQLAAVDRPAAAAVLAKFGVENTVKLKPEDFPAVHVELVEALAKKFDGAPRGDTDDDDDDGVDMSTPTVDEILGMMRGADRFFYLKAWAGTRMPRLWRRSARGYAPVTPSWLREWLQTRPQPVAAKASHALTVAVLSADLSGQFPPVPTEIES
jgi:hypothetical protein